MSAEKRCIEAQVRLDTIYMTGDGTEKGLTESFRWFKIAANKGDFNDMYFLALIYSKG